MAKVIVTYNEIFDINQILEKKELSFKLHLHDACGSQSFTVEPLSNCSCDGHYDEMIQEVTAYFEGKGISIRFLDNKLEFMICS